MVAGSVDGCTILLPGAEHSACGRAATVTTISKRDCNHSSGRVSERWPRQAHSSHNPLGEKLQTAVV